MTNVYLAGPITGLDYKGATDWRLWAKEELFKVGIMGLDPMRAKNFLKEEKNFTAACLNEQKFGCLSSPRGITTRDRWDATRCDVLLVNFMGAKQISIGTCMEIAWADLCRKPIVIAMEDLNNPHNHVMINESTGFLVNSLEEAINVVKAICL